MLNSALVLAPSGELKAIYVSHNLHFVSDKQYLLLIREQLM